MRTFVLFLTISLISFTLEANYYISSTIGHDTNSGLNSNTPFKTIQKAFDIINAGDTVFIMSGTYNEIAFLDKNCDGNGLENSPIVIMPYANHTPIIDGTSISFSDEYNEPKALFDIRGKSYIIISDLKFTNSEKHAMWINHESNNASTNIALHNISIENTADDGIYIKNTSNIKIENATLFNSNEAGILLKDCEDILIKDAKIEQTKSSGIGLWRCSNLIVEHNEIIDARYEGGGGEECITLSNCITFEVKYNKVITKNFQLSNLGIDAKDVSMHGKIHHNYVYGTSNAGIYIDAYGEAGSSTTYNDTLHHIEIYQNHVDSCGRGISIASEQGRPVSDIKVYNNLITKPGQDGIRISSHGQDEDVDSDGLADGDGLRKNIFICNNTIFEKYQHWCKGIHVQSLNVENIHIANNLVMIPSTNGGQIYLNDTAHHEVYTYTNMVWGEIKHPDHEAPNSIIADPLFVDSAMFNFKLMPASPAIDNGTSIDWITNDYSGTPRPDGNGNNQNHFDIGAFEFNENATTKLPLQKVQNDLFKVFPNPSNGNIFIDFMAPCESARVQIANAQGIIIKQLERYPNQKQQSISIGIPGVYFIRLVTKHYKKTTKIMVL